jgi:myo-inositol 2-dehydrogenase/D-chiro-inositol 1-dehydrogenase
LANPAPIVLDSGLGRTAGYSPDWRGRFATAYRTELQAWVDGIHSGNQAPDMASAADGHRATLVADAVIRSMRSPGERLLVDGAPLATGGSGPDALAPAPGLVG